MTELGNAAILTVVFGLRRDHERRERAARILDVPLNRHKELLEGMRFTLERLKATAEAGQHRAAPHLEPHNEGGS